MLRKTVTIILQHDTHFHVTSLMPCRTVVDRQEPLSADIEAVVDRLQQEADERAAQIAAGIRSDDEGNRWNSGDPTGYKELHEFRAMRSVFKGRPVAFADGECLAQRLLGEVVAPHVPGCGGCHACCSQDEGNTQNGDECEEGCEEVEVREPDRDEEGMCCKAACYQLKGRCLRN